MNDLPSFIAAACLLAAAWVALEELWDHLSK